MRSLAHASLDMDHDATVWIKGISHQKAVFIFLEYFSPDFTGKADRTSGSIAEAFQDQPQGVCAQLGILNDLKSAGFAGAQRESGFVLL